MLRGRFRSSPGTAAFLFFLATPATAAPPSSPASAPPQATEPTAPANKPTAPAKHETPREQSAAIVPQATPPPSAIPAQTPEEIRHRRLTVRVDSTRANTVVERRTSVKEEVGAFVVIPFHAVDSTWEQICVTPCEVDLDRFSTYRVSPQNGISGSHPFTLPQRVDALQLNIDGGSLMTHRIGQAMTVLGFTSIIVGGSLLLAAHDFRVPSDARIAAGITGGAGVALAAIGIPLSVTSESHVGSDADKDRRIVRVYNERGYAVPFLPDIKLSRTLTLTQRGIVF
jgi:hypothetical protein